MLDQMEQMEMRLDAMRSDPRRWDIGGKICGPYACFWGMVTQEARRDCLGLAVGEERLVEISRVRVVEAPDEVIVRRVS